MTGVIWADAEQRVREWDIAKEKLKPNGTLLPNGTKLRRKDSPDSLTHSFMVIDGQIMALSGKGNYLKKHDIFGKKANVKLAEDAAGQLFALKITTKSSAVAHDLGVAAYPLSRISGSKKYPSKHYITYKYLGSKLYDYLDTKIELSFDRRYELCIKISLALHRIHAGIAAESQQGYLHNRIQWEHIVIDEAGDPHFISYESSEKISDGIGVKDDVLRMLNLFFLPVETFHRNDDVWVLGDLLGEYELTSDEPRREDGGGYIPERSTIHTYLNSEDEQGGVYRIAHYVVCDPDGTIQQGTVNLSDLGIKDEFLPKKINRWRSALDVNIKELFDKKVREITDNSGYTVKKKESKLFELLKNPKSMASLKALDVAELLTLARFNLESYQARFSLLSPEKRLENTTLLNGISVSLRALYEKLASIVSEHMGLEDFVKECIISCLIDGKKLDLTKFTMEFNEQFNKLGKEGISSIEQLVADVEMQIIRERAKLPPKRIQKASQDAQDKKIQKGSETTSLLQPKNVPLDAAPKLKVASPMLQAKAWKWYHYVLYWFPYILGYRMGPYILQGTHKAPQPSNPKQTEASTAEASSLTHKIPTTLAPPKNNPLGTVASRRNPCFGFTIVSYLEKNFPEVNKFLMSTRDEIIKIVDPDRTTDNRPRKLPGFIKTKSLHACFYGSAPFLRSEDYAAFFQSKTEGLDNGSVLHLMKEKLSAYLLESEPKLIPIGFEFKEEDGTILARYRVQTKDSDPRPLASLKGKLDEGRPNAIPSWDPNPLRDTTVAIVLCVVAVKEEPHKSEQIRAILDAKNLEFKALGEQEITHCTLIGRYDKRTLTRDKHVEVFAEVDKFHVMHGLK